MHKLRAGEFFKALQTASTLHQVLTTASDNRNALNNLVAGDVAAHRASIQTLRDELVSLGLISTSHVADRALEWLDSGTPSQFEGMDVVGYDAGKTLKLATGLSQLTERICDDFRTQSVLIISPAQAAQYAAGDQAMGATVTQQFPSAAFEIDESVKCMGLGRHTAAVFHLMRIVEIGIKAASKCLKIPDPTKAADRNWGTMLRKVREEIDRRNTARAWADIANKEFFEGVYASLDAVKNVWRNTTMHVENKYTEEEADHVFSAVRGFMRLLARRFDEGGQPTA